jgi:dihydroorotate dehydrogenase electron transfer subunit
MAMTVSARSQYLSTVSANDPLCREHFRLEMTLPDFAPTYPGQFIQIACRDMEASDYLDDESLTDWTPGSLPHFSGREIASPLAMLRRPFSLAGRFDSSAGTKLEIIHRVVGVGTDWMARLHPGDAVSIIGPLGNRFALPKSDQPALLVGGGVGIPPMLYLAAALAGKPAVAFCGVTTADLLPLKLISKPSRDAAMPTTCIEEFAQHGIAANLSTDDGSLGLRGYVTAALEAYLDHSPNRTKPVIYTCGPELMMKRVAEIANRRGVECQVAVERAMACGMGTCQSCCIKVKASGRSDGREWVYRLACTDGPVFPGADLLW